MSTTVTVQELDELCKQILEQRQACDAKDAELTELNKKLGGMEAKAVEYLEALGRDNYKSQYGTLSIREKLHWNLPAGPEKWQSLLFHFKETGIYDGMVTVNSQKLNSWAKKEFDIAAEEGRGMEFQIPGLEQPKMHRSLAFIKGK